MMENSTSTSYLDQKTLLVNELTQAKELLKQLESQLGAACATGNLLLLKILSLFENSLSMLNEIKSEAGNESQSTGSTESPRPVNCRRNCGSDLIRDPSKKRKSLTKWTEQVRVCQDSGLEGPLDDGFGWRKYGQKDILGASHPRGYYRCTHRNVQGCVAMKQVQRSDTDPSMFTVIYRGIHTCVQAVNLLPGQSLNRTDQHDQKRRKSRETIMNFQTGCHDKSGDFRTAQVVLNSSSFSFPPASIPIPCIENESNNDDIFSSMTPDNNFMNSPFSSPSTSESISFSPYRVHSSFEGGQSIQTSEVGLSEFTSAFYPTDLYLDFDFLDSIPFDM